jgi:hypothetical protein
MLLEHVGDCRKACGPCPLNCPDYRQRTLGAIGLAALAVPADAQPLEVIGYSGYLGAWELTATVTESIPGRRGYSGPLVMKHVGLCTQDGPEGKTGEIRLLSGQQLDAVLSVAGVSCGYGGRLSDTNNGTPSCADREAVPLKLWVK